MKHSIVNRAVLGLLGVVATAQGAYAATCGYSVTNEWSTGFTAAVQVTNDGSTVIEGWELAWEYTDGSRITNSWNATLSGDNPYTATPLAWNGAISPGQSVDIGLQGTKGQRGSDAPVPEVVGQVCDAGESSSSASSVASSSSLSSAASSASLSSASSSSEGGELPSVTLERIFPNLELERPVAMVPSPDGSRWYILEKRGVISWVDSTDNGAESATAYIDLSDIVNDNVEGGMLDMAFHPDYPANGGIFLSFTESAPADSDASQLSVIARFAESEDGSTLLEASREDILTLEQPFNNHNGGQIRFGPDGYLYIAFGDGGSANDPFNNGQDPNTLYGTLVRIDVNGEAPYSIPADNPFVTGGGAPEVYAYGLRNPWRFSFDPQTDRLWAGDVGQAAFEEVNLIERGGNYGWRCREGFEATENDCTSDGPFIDPVIAYARDEGQAITGGYVYRGVSMPALNGAYVFGDYGSGAVWALTESDPGVYERSLLMETDLLLTAFAEDINGELYAVDISGGALYQLVEEQSSSSASSALSSASASSVSSGVSSSRSSFSSARSSSSSASSVSAVSCTLSRVDSWGGGYQLEVGVTNTSASAISSWAVEMIFDEAPQITSHWNVELSTSGNTVTATDVGWNGVLQPDQSASFGLQGSHSGDFSPPQCLGAQ
ncbi:cellulose binding domain-containing protein [Marinimicrobium locisalis]|uniref:cellulose binding domain-containing protein n=1 Tax=Marinimicrobium locisalis TaxID=546022 RepID=UPI003221B126